MDSGDSESHDSEVHITSSCESDMAITSGESDTSSDVGEDLENDFLSFLNDDDALAGEAEDIAMNIGEMTELDAQTTQCPISTVDLLSFVQQIGNDLDQCFVPHDRETSSNLFAAVGDT